MIILFLKKNFEENKREREGGRDGGVEKEDMEETHQVRV